MKNNYSRAFLYHNFAAIISRMFFLLITGNKLAWKKVARLLKKSEPFLVVNKDITFVAEEAGDLLSICVLQDYRGCGVAQSLMENYIETLRKQNKKLCVLTVETDNERGVGFYKKNGFVPYKEIKDTKCTYAKIL